MVQDVLKTFLLEVLIKALYLIVLDYKFTQAFVQTTFITSILSSRKPQTHPFIMKAVAALVFLGLVALSSAGLLATTIPAATTYSYAHAPIAYSPITYAAANYYTHANYRLTLDTSLPGSAYAAYPNAAAPTAYGYGVIKTL